jgi:hypothetical protein
MKSVMMVVTNESSVSTFCHDAQVIVPVLKKPMLVNVSALKHLAVRWPKGGGRKSRFHTASTGTHCQI